MRVLFDQNVPKPLAAAIQGHEVKRVYELGWDRLVNGELIAAAELAGFDVLVTTDKQWRYQQNLSGRRVAVVVLPTNHWPELRDHTGEISGIIAAGTPGSYHEIERWPPSS